MKKGIQLGLFLALFVLSSQTVASVAESGTPGTPPSLPPASAPLPQGVGAAWETMAPMPEARVFNAVVADGNGYVYSIGGTSDAGAAVPTNSVFRYNTATDSWDTMSPLPTVIDSAAAAIVDNTIYVAGGSSSADTFVYDIATDSWSTIAANGGYSPRSQYQMVVIGTDVFVLGGIVASLSESTTEVWILDTTSDTWSAGTPMQQSRTSFSAAAIDGEIYVAGGVLFPGFVPDMSAERFDGTSWSFIAGVPNGGGVYTRWSYQATTSTADRMWLAAGRRDADWTVLDHAGYYEPATDSWLDSPALPSLNQGRVYMDGAVATDGYFYVIGGRDPAGSVNYAVNERLFIGMPVVLEFEVGGAISNLVGAGLVLEETVSGLTVSPPGGTTDYAFTLDDGAEYNIVVQIQPSSPAQNCIVSNPAGTVSGADVTNVEVSCTTESFSVGGSVTGLAGSGLVLIDVESGLTQALAAGAVSHAFTLADGSDYDVQIQSQPAGQSCSVSNGAGTLAGADVTNVDVVCSDIAIAISATSVAFGDLQPGDSSESVLTISNPGSELLALQSLIEPTSPFSVTGGTCLPLQTALAAGESCTIIVSFTETEPGEYQDQLQILSNAASSPTTVSLSGSISVPRPAIAVPVGSWPALLLMMAALMALALLRLRPDA